MEELLTETVKKVMIPMFYNESQIGRSLKKRFPKFKKELFYSILELIEKADKGTLTNEDIRKKIKEVSERAKVSIGQSQKVINVTLKYYCILTNKPKEVIKELDCPLDSLIMSENKTKNLKRVALKDMTFEDYIKWQNHLEKLGDGIRVKPDIETYDKKRIKLFLS